MKCPRLARLAKLGGIATILNLALVEAATEPQPHYLQDSKYSTRFPETTWDNDAWTLTSTKAANDDWRAQSFVANGYIGSTFASTGPFPQIWPESNGNPMFGNRSTFGTVAGFFDRQPEVEGDWFTWLRQYGWDSVISGLPSWGSLVVDLGDNVYLDGTVNPDDLSNVALRQDFKRGLASQEYTWTPKEKSSVSIDVSYHVFADKLHPNRAYVQLKLTPNTDLDASIVSVLDGATALRTDFVEKGMDDNVMYTAVRPNGVPDVTAWIHSTVSGAGIYQSDIKQVASAFDHPYINEHESTMAQEVKVRLHKGQTFAMTKVVGIATNDAFSDPDEKAYEEMWEALNVGFDAALEKHVQEWATVFPPTSVSSFADPATGVVPNHLIDKQITSVVGAAMLLMNTVSENAMKSVKNAPINVEGISVCGLLSDCYGGQRFWDQDLWMAPYLAATHPFEAKSIPLQRVKQYDQAKMNIETAYTSSKDGMPFSVDAAIYPWSTGRDGNCTALGPCWDNEYHLNGDIVRSFVTYWAATGDEDFFKNTLLPIAHSMATLYSDLLQQDVMTKQWNLRNMTDPDETAQHVDNGAYTMSLIQWTLVTVARFLKYYGQDASSLWYHQAENLVIPMSADGQITLEYDGMRGSIVSKQADVNLRTYPLNSDINWPIKHQRQDLSYYASKMSRDGPAMTSAIFSIVSSTLSTEGCSAYSYDSASYVPYIRGPFYGFTEGINADAAYSPSYPFLTGYGGFLQIDLFGYLGLRYEPTHHIQLSPNIPPHIHYIRFPTFHYRGWPISAETTAEGILLKRLDTPATNADPKYASENIVFEVPMGLDKEYSNYFPVPPGGTVLIPNHHTAGHETIANNILQCKPVAWSENGDIPEAAIDGSRGSVWHATDAAEISSLTVDLSSSRQGTVQKIYINWGAYVPETFSVIFHNQVDGDYRIAADDDAQTISYGHLSVSRPYNSFANEVVHFYDGNSTEIDVSHKDIRTTKWATLVTRGNQGGPSGATVAEWAVIVNYDGVNPQDPLDTTVTEQQYYWEQLELQRQKEAAKKLRPPLPPVDDDEDDEDEDEDEEDDEEDDNWTWPWSTF